MSKETAMPARNPMTSFILDLPQIVPESWCLNCKVCCRFPDTVDVQTPAWSALEAGWAKESAGRETWFLKAPAGASIHPRLQSCDHGVHCPAFRPEDNTCSIYLVRPLDCRLYPFVLAKDTAGTKVILAMDPKCPFIQAHGQDVEVGEYALKLASILETPLGLEYLQTNPDIVGRFWPEFICVAALTSLTREIAPSPAQPPHPSLRPLTWQDLPLLQEALLCARHEASSYTLAGIMGWSDLVRYWWIWLEGFFCLYAEQAGGFFMPLPPLGKNVSIPLLGQAWKILVELNRGNHVSRIDGVEPSLWDRLSNQGVRLSESGPEYLYRQSDLAALRGDRFRSQRWAINHLARRSSCRVRPFEENDLVSCLQLYTLWAIRRQQDVQDPLLRRLIRDSLFFHRRLMMNWKELGVSGRVLEIDGQLRGYTFGAPVSSDVFCVFLEITDRSCQGAAQYLFRELSRELKNYTWINAMGDEGMAGLRRAKEAYHPAEFVKSASAVLVELEGVEPSTS